MVTGANKQKSEINEHKIFRRCGYYANAESAFCSGQFIPLCLRYTLGDVKLNFNTKQRGLKDMNPRILRRKFVVGLFDGLRIVWPILSALLVLIVTLGVLAGLREGWSLQESVYFSFVSGLTIGYGDFAPKTLLGRTLSIIIGICGALVIAVVAAVAVKALTSAQESADE